MILTYHIGNKSIKEHLSKPVLTGLLFILLETPIRDK
jgi:hypothetical protein